MIDEKLNSSNNKSVNHRGNQYQQQVTLQNMEQLEFYMDISPEWWIKSRKDESCIKKYICLLKINTIFINDDIKPNHYKNIKKLSKDNIEIIDRTCLILNIFSNNAKTND